MSYRNSDNIYPEGTILVSKANRDVKLKIESYNQRIYYCSTVGDESKKQLAYFERELVPPVGTQRNPIPSTKTKPE
jgi:hypothetical protein